MVWPESSSSAARTSPRTRHWNPGLDIRVIFEEGRENAKFSRGVMRRVLVFEPRSDDTLYRLPTKYSLVPVGGKS